MAEVVFGKTAEIENEKVVVRRFGRTRVAVCKYENNYYAFKDVCTHDNGPLDQGELCGNIIECPRHGAKFDVTTGAVVAAPAYEPLEVYSVRVDGDEIKVSLE
jgi:3-phenylpropionate/trans-cinnamate dioxygenase ferredoxin subunit